MADAKLLISDVADEADAQGTQESFSGRQKWTEIAWRKSSS
jgi:hypothetical protein